MSIKENRTLRVRIITYIAALVLTLILSILIEPIYGLETPKEDITERLREMSNELTQYTKELERIEECFGYSVNQDY